MPTLHGEVYSLLFLLFAYELLFLIGMHRYHFFQYSPDTDTFIFGTCRYRVPIPIFSLHLYIFKILGTETKRVCIMSIVHYTLVNLINQIDSQTKIYSDTFNISHIISVYSL